MPLISMLLVSIFTCEAQAGYHYQVEEEISHGESWIIAGTDGRYLCEAMSYCFSLGQGIRFTSASSIWLTPARFTVNGQECTLWDCKEMRGAGSSQADVNKAIAAEIKRLEAQIKAIESGKSAGAAGVYRPEAGPSKTTGCTTAAITAPIPFMGNSGEVVVLTDGSVWKVGIGEYNYLYEYYSTVKICGGNQMVVDSTILAVDRIK